MGKKNTKVSGETIATEPTRVKEILKTSLQNTLVKRQGGDGESLPDTPPNERQNEERSIKKTSSSKLQNPFQVQLSIDFMAVILFVVGLAIRLHKLDQPRHVV